MSRRAIIATVGVALLLVAAMAYGSTRRRVDDPDDTTLDDTTLLADSLLTAFDAGDYDEFSAHFTDALRTELDEAAFEEWRAPLSDSLGPHRRVTNTRVRKGSKTDPLRYRFAISFANDDSVEFVIGFEPGTDRINRIDLDPDK